MADVNYNEKKQVESVVDQPAKVREKGLGGRLADIFLSENASKVKSYIVTDVIIPAIKDTIVNIVQNGVEMLFYGETTASPRGKKSDGGTYVSYNGYYNSGSKSNTARSSDRDRSWHNSRDVLFASRGDAERAKAELIAIFRRYKTASVADLCHLADVESTYMEEKWGWYDLEDRDIHVRSVRGGYYMLELPKPMYLE